MSLVLKPYSSEEHLYLVQYQLLSQLKKHRGKLPARQKLEYCQAIIGSKYLCEVESGAQMLLAMQEEIKNDENKWGMSMYFLAVAMARLEKYDKAFEYIRCVLDRYPEDEKTIDLMEAIFEKVAKKPSYIKDTFTSKEKHVLKIIGVASVATIGVCAVGALAFYLYRKL